MITLFTTAFLAAILGLVPIVNPLGMAPIFLRVTEGVSERMRDIIAMRIAIGSFFLMLGSLFVGSYILAFFGLTLPAVQIAGGVVVFAAGWRMLQQGDDSNDRERRSPDNDEMILTRTFFPMTMPLTVGPGTISVAITLGAKGAGTEAPLLVAAGSILGIIGVAAVIYLCYRFAGQVLRRLGEMGTDVVIRLSAFILLCLGVQIIWNGAQVFLAMAGAHPPIPG